MSKHIYKCLSCGKYTLEEECSCGGKAILPRPPKFSLDDKYADLKRKVKKEELQKKGLY
jgi:H/ACA ribonucleoprotein complex subunit 3